ncbi:MAG: Crp/Fnr family transcriptional regulator [Chitinophagaceae bacterium]|nr:Crp/Fnr family transcriptional regulator [Chitinophagaceae bacterium]
MVDFELSEILHVALQPYYDAPKETWNHFASHCEVVTVPKNAILKERNKPEAFFYFIIHGSLGLFLQNENQQVCLDFAFQHAFFGDYMSILTQQATPLELIALEKSQLARIQSQTFIELGQTPIGSIIMRACAEVSFLSKQAQQIDLLTKTAKQRYNDLLLRYPDIESKVSQKHLASYLGVTPQSFSRLQRST